MFSIVSADQFIIDLCNQKALKIKIPCHYNTPDVFCFCFQFNSLVATTTFIIVLFGGWGRGCCFWLVSFLSLLSEFLFLFLFIVSFLFVFVFFFYGCCLLYFLSFFAFFFFYPLFRFVSIIIYVEIYCLSVRVCEFMKEGVSSLTTTQSISD